MWSKRILTVCLTILGLIAPPAWVNMSDAVAADLPPGGTFQDDDGSPHEGNIEAIYAEGITKGCAPSRFCPAGVVTREQMAAFIDRALGLPPTTIDFFTDDEASAFEPSINRLAAAELTAGCAPGRFCPSANVTRAEMATFLVRALELAPSSVDHFWDDDGSPFEPDIDSLAAAGITKGCATGRYCPHGAVSRAEMASFLARGLGLDPIVAPPSDFAGTTLYVDVADPSASDANPGTSTAPLRTIQVAVDRADPIRKSGQAVRILIAAGTYREHIRVGHSTADAPALLMEAEQPGTVRVTGTDAWTGWETVSTGVYARAWPFDWTPASGVAQIVGRREVAFHNGARLRQELSIAALQPGSFFVDDQANRIYVALSGGPPTTVEVGVRPQLLFVDGARNLTIRGLEFSGAASPFGSSAVQITNVANVTIRDSVVRDNSWVGVSVATSNGVTLQSNRVNSNGGGGMNIFQVPGVQLVSTETSANNWRGVRGDYTGLTIAGVKIVGSHDVTIDGHRAVGNHTRGLWFDYDISGLSISDSLLCGNLTDGLFIEAAQGPSSVTGTTMCDNGRYGLLISNGRAVTVGGSAMCGNAKSALRLESDGASGRTIQTASGSILLAGADSLTLTGNTLGGSPRLFDSNLPSGQWSTFVSTLTSDLNTFQSGVTTFFYEQNAHTLAEWRGATGEDGGSVLASTPC